MALHFPDILERLELQFRKLSRKEERYGDRLTRIMAELSIVFIP
jgi:hypothetical protein